MRLFRSRRLAAACRLVFPLIFFLAGTLVAPAATLSGRVTDPDGRGVPNAQVIVANALGTVADHATDSAGDYEIPTLPAGRYELRVMVPGFQADPLSVTLSDDERMDASVQLRLSAVADSIVVSAAQIDLPLSRAADSVTVITAAQLQDRLVDTVADALRLVPGMSVTQGGGPGAVTSVFPRGGGSNYTLVLVDGMRLNAFGGGFDFGHFSVADIDRIEIVRGPQSALFGSDAIGTVVHVVTRRGGRPRVDGLIEGSGDVRRATIGTAGSSGNWSWGAGAERATSDGFSGLAANGERVGNDDDRRAHLSGSIGWTRPNGWNVLINGNLGNHERGSPGPFGSDPIGVFEGVDRISRSSGDNRQIGTRILHPWTDNLRQRIEVSYSDLTGEFLSAFDTDHPSVTGTRRLDLRVQEDAVLAPALSASAGVEHVLERGSSTFVTGERGQEVPIERSVTGLFGEVRVNVGDRLAVRAGARVERLTRARVEGDPLGFSPRPAFAEQTTTSVNPKVAVSYELSSPGRSRSPTRLRFSAGTGIRPPDVFEIGFTDNPQLKPERSRSIDAGVEQQFVGGAYHLAATVFANRYDDLLITVGSSLAGASVYRTDNISNGRARGVELSGSARLPAGFSIDASYTFLATEILSVDGLNEVAPAPFEVGDALLRRPNHHGGVNATYRSARWSGFVELIARSKVLDVEPNFGSFGGLFFTAAYAVANAGISVPVSSGVQIFARALNLADRSYEEVLGFPAPRRNGIVGVRIAASR